MPVCWGKLDSSPHFSGKPSWAGEPPSPVEPSGNRVVIFGSHRLFSLFLPLLIFRCVALLHNVSALLTVFCN